MTTAQKVIARIIIITMTETIAITSDKLSPPSTVPFFMILINPMLYSSVPFATSTLIIGRGTKHFNTRILYIFTFISFIWVTATNVISGLHFKI